VATEKGDAGKLIRATIAPSLPGGVDAALVEPGSLAEVLVEPGGSDDLPVEQPDAATATPTAMAAMAAMAAASRNQFGART
jgi:hypothetical protein